MSIEFHYDPKSDKRILAEFCHGVPGNRTELVCKFYQEKRQNDPKFKDRKMILVKGKFVDYVGDNFSYRRSHPYANRYALAKVNRKTGTAEVFDTDFFKLRPIEKSSTKQKTSEDHHQLGFAEKDDKLTSLFGTKLSKAAQLAAHRSKFADTTIAQDVEAIVQSKDFKVHHDDFSYVSHLIPFNKEAKSVEDVYPLFEVIPMNVFYSASDSAENLFETAKVDFAKWMNSVGKKFCQYLTEHVQNPGNKIMDNQDLYTKYFICLQFIIYMIKITTSSQKTYSLRSKVFLGLTNEVKAFCASTYFTTSGNTMTQPDRLKDKAIATAIILAWHLDSFNVDSEKLRVPFDTTPARFTLIVKTLGGEVKDGRAKLSLPLKFSAEHRTRKRLAKLLHNNHK